MSVGQYLCLEEAWKLGLLKRFVKEHPSGEAGGPMRSLACAR